MEWSMTYIVCEIGEDGDILYVLSRCEDKAEATLRVNIHHTAKKGSIHYIRNPIAVYQRVSTHHRGDEPL